MEQKTRLLLAASAALAVLAVPFAAGIVPGGSGSGGSGGTSNAADKTAVAGSGLEVLGAPASSAAGAAASSAMTKTVLATTIKTSSPTDLVLSVTLECALWTTVATVGNGVAESTARVKVWVELDGQPVAVASDDTQETGKVVFCDRTHRQATERFDDEDATLEQYLRTRTANAFTWIALDVGSAPSPHTIEVKAELSGETQDIAFAQAAVGKRTLVVEPVKLAHGATL
jgi:hypothetical protein